MKTSFDPITFAKSMHGHALTPQKLPATTITRNILSKESTRTTYTPVLANVPCVGYISIEGFLMTIGSRKPLALPKTCIHVCSSMDSPFSVQSAEIDTYFILHVRSRVNISAFRAVGQASCGLNHYKEPFGR